MDTLLRKFSKELKLFSPKEQEEIINNFKGLSMQDKKNFIAQFINLTPPNSYAMTQHFIFANQKWLPSSKNLIQLNSSKDYTVSILFNQNFQNYLKFSTFANLSLLPEAW